MRADRLHARAATERADAAAALAWANDPSQSMLWRSLFLDAARDCETRAAKLDREAARFEVGWRRWWP